MTNDKQGRITSRYDKKTQDNKYRLQKEKIIKLRIYQPSHQV